MNELVNVIIRFHEAAKLRQLSAALFAVFAQQHQPVQAVVVLQNFCPVDVAAVEQVVQTFRWSAPRVKPLLHNATVPPGDQRSKLLNEGLRLCTGRYLAFFDYDDILYRHAYAFLVNRLCRTGAALAFGRVYRKDVVPGTAFDHHFARSSPFHGRTRLDLFQTNFCPLHSYLIDRAAIPPEELWFDEGLTRLEDYDFLLRLCAKHRTDFGGLDKFIGEYVIRSDGSNSALSEYPQDAGNISQWHAAQRQVCRTRERLTPQLTVQEILQVMQALPRAG
jgi:hypothetical protein